MKLIQLTDMIKESEIVTKEYLKKELITFGTSLKSEIIKEVRVMIYEANENSKVYYEETTKRHMGALREGFKEDLRGISDGIKWLIEKTENHDRRITDIETKII